MNCPRCTFENDADSKICVVCYSSMYKRPIELTNNTNLSESNDTSNSLKSSLGSSVQASNCNNINESCKRCKVTLSDNCRINGECSVCGNVINSYRNIENVSAYKKSNVICFKCHAIGHYANYCPLRPQANIKGGSKYFPSELATDGIVELIIAELKQQSNLSEFHLCRPFPHISQLGVEGVRWSCGYRNIQMLCAALMEEPRYRSRLFNGSGEVPDINGIQSWIETAWKSGFDVEGAEQLGFSLLGTETWIGATECAALLRFFGVDARVVDFECSTVTSDILKERLQQWIKRYFNANINNDVSAKTQAVEESTASSLGIVDLTASPDLSSVTNHWRMPVYFQHDGHSRTIIGYEQLDVLELKRDNAKKKSSRTNSFNLLVFDPSSDGKTIYHNLREGSGRWKQQVKRGMHTITKSAYQLVYAAGVLSDTERIKSKILRSCKHDDIIVIT